MSKRSFRFRGQPLRKHLETLEARRLLSAAVDSAADLVDSVVAIIPVIDQPAGPVAPVTVGDGSAVTPVDVATDPTTTTDSTDTNTDTSTTADTGIVPVVEVLPVDPAPVTDTPTATGPVAPVAEPVTPVDPTPVVDTPTLPEVPVVPATPDTPVTPVADTDPVAPVTPEIPVVDVPVVPTPELPVVDTTPVTPVIDLPVVDVPVIDLPVIDLPVIPQTPTEPVASNDPPAGDNGAGTIIDSPIIDIPVVDLPVVDLPVAGDTGGEIKPIDTILPVDPIVDNTGGATDPIGSGVIDALPPVGDVGGVVSTLPETTPITTPETKTDFGGETSTTGGGFAELPIVDYTPIATDTGSSYGDVKFDNTPTTSSAPLAPIIQVTYTPVVEKSAISTFTIPSAQTNRWHQGDVTASHTQHASTPTTSEEVLSSGTQFTGGSSKGTFSESPIPQATLSEAHASTTHSTQQPAVAAAPGSVATGESTSAVATPTLTAPAAAVASSINPDEVTAVQTTAQLGDGAVVDGTESTGLAQHLSDRRFGPVAAGGEAIVAKHRTVTRAMVRVETLSAMVVADPEEEQQVAAVASAAITAADQSTADAPTEVADLGPQRVMATVATSYQPEPANVHNIMAAALAGTTFIAIHWHRWRKRRMEAASSAASRLGSLLRFDPLAAWIDDRDQD